MTKTPAQVNRIAWLVAAVFFLQLLDSTIITTALPAMAADFGVSPVTMSVGITAYLLALAVVVPAAGWLGERFGARAILVVSISTFTAASLGCALAPNLAVFILARIVQGAAAALMAPVGRMLVLRHSTKSDLVRSMATITWPALTAPVIGPVLGGWITETAGWEWNFLINVPLGLVAIFLFLRLVPSGPTMRPNPFDWRGYLLTALALTLTLGGLEIVVGGHALAGMLLWGAGAGVGFAAIRYLRAAAHPLFDLRVLRHASFRLSTITAGSSLRIAISATPFLLPLLFQVGFGLSAIETGQLLLVYFLGNFTAKSVTTPLLRHAGFRSLATLNGLLCGLSIAIFAAVPQSLDWLALAVLLFAAGAVRSVQFTTLNTLAYADIEPAETATAATLSAIMQQVTMLLGVALAVAAVRTSKIVTGADPGLTDFRAALLAMGVLGLLGALAFLRLDPGTGQEVSGHRGRLREAG